MRFWRKIVYNSWHHQSSISPPNKKKDAAPSTKALKSAHAVAVVSFRRSLFTGHDVSDFILLE
jgi:hypothetical protein